MGKHYNSVIARIREIQRHRQEQSQEPEIATRRLTADAWQEFKRKFVETYGGEPVEPTGMTHSEFLHYIKTSGQRENDEFRGINSLKDLLQKMDQDDLGQG